MDEFVETNKQTNNWINKISLIPKRFTLNCRKIFIAICLPKKSEHIWHIKSCLIRDFHLFIYLCTNLSFQISRVRIYVKAPRYRQGRSPSKLLLLRAPCKPPKVPPLTTASLRRHSHHWLPKITAPQGGTLLITPRRADEEHIAVMNLNAPGMMCSADLYQLITLGPMLFHLPCAAFWKERRKKERDNKQKIKTQ